MAPRAGAVDRVVAGRICPSHFGASGRAKSTVDPLFSGWLEGGLSHEVTKCYNILRGVVLQDSLTTGCEVVGFP